MHKMCIVVSVEFVFLDVFFLMAVMREQTAIQQFLKYINLDHESISNVGDSVQFFYCLQLLS